MENNDETVKRIETPLPVHERRAEYYRHLSAHMLRAGFDTDSDVVTIWPMVWDMDLDRGTFEHVLLCQLSVPRRVARDLHKQLGELLDRFDEVRAAELEKLVPRAFAKPEGAEGPAEEERDA